MDPSGMSSSRWIEIIEAMEEIAPDYDRVNQLITFGLADRWRKEIATSARVDDVVLEIGSGPGSFAKQLTSGTVYCIDPSRALMQGSRQDLDGDRVILLQGVAEGIPLADNSVDKVFCVFSFRDFFDKEKSLAEIFRVLKEGGEVRIADIAKPLPGPFGKLLEMHVKHVVPRLARVAVSPAAYDRLRRDPYKTFTDTYQAFGFTSAYECLLEKKGFTDVTTEFLRMKGATVTRGTRPWRSTYS